MLKLNRKFIERLSIFLILILMLESNVTFASKKVDPEFPSSPSAKSDKNAVSEGVIYSPMKGLTAKSPNHPTPSTIDEKEKKLYDNYDVSVDTLSKRIEYFSPTYQYARSLAENTISYTLMQNGISIDGTQYLHDMAVEHESDIRDDKKLIKNYNVELSKLTPGSAEAIAIQNKIDELSNECIQLTISAKTNRAYAGKYFYSLNMVRRAEQIAGLGYTKDMLTKALTSALLGYFQFNYYTNILDKLVELNNKKYILYKKNFDLGICTELEYNEAYTEYMDSISSRDAIKNQRDNIKRTLIINLGYDLELDYDKVNFVEPHIDMVTLASINPENDYAHAYNSNKTYLSAQSDNQSRRGNEDEYNKRIRDNYKNQYRDKVIANLDSAYAELASAYKNYEASKLIEEAYYMDLESTKRKKELNLVSDIEGIGLDIQNLQTEMNIHQSLFDLTNAYYNYYFATFGLLDIE